MKERVGALVGPVARRMWVSTFHSACAADPAARGHGPRLPQLVLDLRRVRRGPARRLRAARSQPGPEAVPAASAAPRDLGAQERARGAGGGEVQGAHATRGAHRRGVRGVPAPARRGLRRRLRRPAAARRAAVPRPPRRARPLAPPLRARARRRVPGHERRAVGARAPPHPRAPQRHGRRRRRSIGLPLPRGGPPQPHAVRGGVPRGVDHRPRPELPVDADDPRRRERGHRQQRGAPSQAPVDRAGGWRAHHPVPRRGRARRGELRGARDRPARGRRADPLRRRRRVLPDERAEPGRGGGVRPRRDAVPHRRWHEVLRPA